MASSRSSMTANRIRLKRQSCVTMGKAADLRSTSMRCHLRKRLRLFSSSIRSRSNPEVEADTRSALHEAEGAQAARDLLALGQSKPVVVDANNRNLRMQLYPISSVRRLDDPSPAVQEPEPLRVSV